MEAVILSGLQAAKDLCSWVDSAGLLPRSCGT